MDCMSCAGFQLASKMITRLAATRLIPNPPALVDIKNNAGNTALMRASANGHTEVLRILCENGADVTNWDRKDDYMREACNNGQNKLVKGLLQGGANPNTAGCVQISLELYYHEIFVMLIEAGAEVNQVSKNICCD